jgi:hypothetical protein
VRRLLVLDPFQQIVERATRRRFGEVDHGPHSVCTTSIRPSPTRAAPARPAGNAASWYRAAPSDFLVRVWNCRICNFASCGLQTCPDGNQSSAAARIFCQEMPTTNLPCWQWPANRDLSTELGAGGSTMRSAVSESTAPANRIAPAEPANRDRIRPPNDPFQARGSPACGFLWRGATSHRR